MSGVAGLAPPEALGRIGASSFAASRGPLPHRAGRQRPDECHPSLCSGPPGPRGVPGSAPFSDQLTGTLIPHSPGTLFHVREQSQGPGLGMDGVGWDAIGRESLCLSSSSSASHRLANRPNERSHLWVAKLGADPPWEDPPHPTPPYRETLQPLWVSPIPRRPGFQAPLGPASWRRKNTVQGPPSSTAHGPQHTPRPNPTGCRAVPCRATRISFKPSHLSTCFRVFTPFPLAGQPHSLQLVTHPALTELGLQSAGNGLGGFAPQPPHRWSAP